MLRSQFFGDTTYFLKQQNTITSLIVEMHLYLCITYSCSIALIEPGLKLRRRRAFVFIDFEVAAFGAQLHKEQEERKAPQKMHFTPKKDSF